MRIESTTALCRLLGDANRLRLLRLLEREQLTVTELTQVTQLGQSTVSTQLKKLREAGLVQARPAGAATFYGLTPNLDEPLAAWWRFVRGQAQDPQFEADHGRMTLVLEARGGSWADTVAGRMSRHYSPGRTWASFARGIAGLVRLGDVLDVASGDGALAELLAPNVGSVTCLDRSERVVRSGSARLASVSNVRFVRGDMHDLPFENARFDAVLLMSALCHAATPSVVLSEAARALAPGGRLVIVTLAEHGHADAVAPFGHVQLGFTPRWLRQQLEGQGLIVDLCEVTQRERRPPHFEVLTVHGRKP